MPKGFSRRVVSFFCLPSFIGNVENNEYPVSLSYLSVTLFITV